MHIDPYIVFGSAIIGLLVGVTGAGGGALMTPMLILLFHVKASAAISSDLVAAVLMRPIGSAVHLHKGTVNYRLVGWLSLGSVPMALLGTYLLHLIGHSSASQKHIEVALGSALLVGAGAMIIRYVMDRVSNGTRGSLIDELVVRPLPTLVVGMIGGVIVGMTSVGAGSLMIILLLFVYPAIGTKQLVGSDLTQAIPLTFAAALGSMIFGHVEFGLTTSIIIGAIPAVFIGSLLSSRAPDRAIRPVIAFVVLASGLKYVGLSTPVLGWVLIATLGLGGIAWLEVRRPWNKTREHARPTENIPDQKDLTPV